MSIRRPAMLHALAGFFSVGLVFAGTSVAGAETSDLQACAAQYQAAKADNKLNGQAWQDFFTDCKAHLSAAVPVTPEAKAPVEPAAAPKNEAEKPEPTAEPATPAVAETPAAPAKDEKAAAEAREKKCRAQWKAQETELKKKDSKWTWSRYWKKCNEKPSSTKG